MTTVRVACAGIVGIALTAALAAQRPPRPPRYKVDPYTRNDPEQMARAGYLSYGPFQFGTRGSGEVTSDDIERHLHYAELIWVETAHYRIGISLDAYRVPEEPETKKKIRAELEKLKEVLPRVNPKTRVLDRWLRLHLTAQRLEELYQEVQERLGVKDADFPKQKKDVIIGRGRYMGYGPYLGQPNKYLVLVTEKGGTYLDYLKSYIGKTGAFGQRWNFKLVGSLFYGIGADLEKKTKHDTGLHNDLRFNVSHLLIDGFRNYSYDLPVWIKEGLAHWFERSNNPKWNTFTQNEGGLADKKPLWRWKPYARGLLSRGKFTGFSTVYAWRDYTQLVFDDHVLIWSRWDYLMSLGNEKFSQFMFHVKGRVDPATWLTDQTDLVGATRDALRTVYGLTPLNFDEKWKEWVMANYPAQ